MKFLLLPLAALATATAAFAAPAAPAPSFSAAATAPTGWWHSLGDGDLALLVDKALAANLDIEQAAARLDRAGAAAAAVRASLLPNSNLGASAAAVRQSLEDPAIRPFANIPGFPRNVERYDVGLSASWEIDLFGSAPRRRGARASTEAAAADLAAARVAVAAETASAWLSVRELQLRRANIAAQLTALDKQADIARRQLAAGTTAAIDVDRITAERAGQQAAFHTLDGLVAAEIERLGVLIADAATARALAERRKADPALPVVPDIAQLSVTLAERPDVVAAERRLVAADAALATAKSERLPRISLSGLLATVASGPAALFTAAAQSARGSGLISMPFLDFGRIEAGIDDARGGRRAALAAWQQTTMQAAADVERSAALLASSRAEAGALGTATEASSSAWRRAGTAYAAGVIDLTTLLDIERRSLVSEDRLIAARASTMKALVSLYRATADIGSANAPSRTPS
jgi:NodT family efflux transporter outer membrane factor (OMF) lipoprotein